MRCRPTQSVLNVNAIHCPSRTPCFDFPTVGAVKLRGPTGAALQKHVNLWSTAGSIWMNIWIRKSPTLTFAAQDLILIETWELIIMFPQGLSWSWRDNTTAFLGRIWHWPCCSFWSCRLAEVARPLSYSMTVHFWEVKKKHAKIKYK